MPSGAFNYWPENGTTRAMTLRLFMRCTFLTEAKAQGYQVPADVFSAGIGFLKDLASKDAADLEQVRLHAYAIYVLTAMKSLLQII